MRTHTISHRISLALLRLGTAIAPGDLLPWTQAMTGELEAVDGKFAKITWALGCFAVLVRLRASWIATCVAERPAPVVGACLYLAGFSAFVIWLIVYQMLTGTIHAPWYEAAIPVLICLALAALPGIIAFGLWLLDDSARVLCTVFALFHALSCLAWMSRPGVHPATPSARFAINFVLVAVMTSPGVRNAFRERRTELRLDV